MISLFFLAMNFACHFCLFAKFQKWYVFISCCTLKSDMDRSFTISLTYSKVHFIVLLIPRFYGVYVFYDRIVFPPVFPSQYTLKERKKYRFYLLCTFPLVDGGRKYGACPFHESYPTESTIGKVRQIFFPNCIVCMKPTVSCSSAIFHSWFSAQYETHSLCEYSS